MAVGKQLVTDFPGRPEFSQELARGLVGLGNLLLIGDRLKEAEAAYREALALLKPLSNDDPSRPEYRAGLALIHYKLGCTLSQQRRPADAVAEYREAIRLKEDYPQAHNNLGNILQDTDDLNGAIAEFRQAIGTKEKFPEAYKAHSNLGRALARNGRRDEAIAEYRAALRINNEYAEAHYGLGNTLYEDRLDEAICEYREALRINEDYAEAHVNLGNSLGRKGKLDEAIAEYRKAIAIKKDLFEAHINLGRALQLRGLLKGAIVEYREAVRLQKNNADAGEQLRQAEHLARFDERLPGVVEGKDQPKDAAECLFFAQLCMPPYREQYADAVRLFGTAFAAEPRLATDLQSAHRYNAACAATLASCGQGKGADRLDDKERTHLRGQAMEWLRSDLTSWGRLLDGDPAKSQQVVEVLRHWLDDRDFTGVRGPEALAKLPESERHEWQKLWDGAAEMLKRAEGKTASEKK